MWHETSKIYYRFVLLLHVSYYDIDVYLSQCAILVFKGLFPPDHNVIIQSLIYRFTHWHTLVKLRVHSETTLLALNKTFTRLCNQLHKFHSFTCAAIATTELLKERAARECKAAHECSGPCNPDSESGGEEKRSGLQENLRWKGDNSMSRRQAKVRPKDSY
jgi:hypothetical protein